MECRQRLSILGLEEKRDHIHTFTFLFSHAQCAEPAPCTRWRRWSETGVSALLVCMQESFERCPPSLTERGNLNRPAQRFTGMPWKIEQTIHLRHRKSLWPIRDLYDLITRRDLSFLKHTKIKPRPLLSDHQCGHLRILHAYAKPITGHPWLRHLKQCGPNSVTISDTNLIVPQTVHRKVLAELSILKLTQLKLCLPVAIRVELIHHHGTLFSAVPRKIALAIAIQVQTAGHHLARDRDLPYPGPHDLA